MADAAGGHIKQRAGDARCKNTVGTNRYVEWMAVAVTWVALWYTCAEITSPDTIWIGYRPGHLECMALAGSLHTLRLRVGKIVVITEPTHELPSSC